MYGTHQVENTFVIFMINLFSVIFLYVMPGMQDGKPCNVAVMYGSPVSLMDVAICFRQRPFQYLFL